MLERAQVVGQVPARRTGISEADLARVLSIPPAQIRAVVERAVPRPVTPVYTQLSDILQIQLHRALTRQATPEAALRDAQEQMQRLLDRVGLGAGGARASR
jgi:multiple sugar transport system substrate-binding protein